jgi:class 3 adenylate cyclase
MTERKRKLAAVMFTDMFGYSALTEKNEAGTLDLLEEHRKLLRPIFPKYGGREVEAPGDAFFVEFESTSEAISCSKEIQKTLHDRNASLPPEQRIYIRIGIHVGDVVHMGENVHGHEVNLQPG